MRQTLVIFALMILISYLTAAPPAASQDYPPFGCTNLTGTYYRPNLFPHFTNLNYRLVLADWSTGEEIITLADELPYEFGFSWSPDCQYLVGYSGKYNGCQPGLIIWDTVSSERRLTLDGFCDTGNYGAPGVFWKADSSVVLLSEWQSGPNSQGSEGNRLLWYPKTGQQIRLQITRIAPNFQHIYWDDARSWVWGSADAGVTAFDVNTGAQVVSFKNPPAVEPDYTYYYTRSNFAFSPDFSKVIVYGQTNNENWTRPAMTVYDIASGQGLEVNVELNGAGTVALSPDNRYLVMAYSALRVWDMQNLAPTVEERLPVYRHALPGNYASAVRFVDGNTVEVTMDGGEIVLIDIHTGQVIP